MVCPWCDSQRVSDETLVTAERGMPNLEFDHPDEGWTKRPGAFKIKRARMCFDCGYVLLFTGVSVPPEEAQKLTARSR